MHLVLGLGNPGARYAGTRHNVGFLVADTLARRAGAGIDRDQLGAVVGKITVGGKPVTVAKPQKFMNLSGGPGQQLAAFYKVPVDHTVVVHDELDLPFGDVRVKVGGGHGGHNGLRDLIGRMGPEFVRVRVGVSRPPPGWETANYVLAGWSDAEASQLAEVVAQAADAVEAVVVDGTVAAMNKFNVRRGAAEA